VEKRRKKLKMKIGMLRNIGKQKGKGWGKSLLGMGRQEDDKRKVRGGREQVNKWKVGGESRKEGGGEGTGVEEKSDVGYSVDVVAGPRWS